MNIEYIGSPDANIEGRYNDMYYFIDKIVSLENRFIKELHIGNIKYGNTEEYDDITVVPYEKGIIFKIDNLDSDPDNNNTTASLVVLENEIYFILTKADWNHNRNTDLQKGITKNIEKENEFIEKMGLALETDKICEYEKGTGLVKLGQTMRENRQRKQYEEVFKKSVNNLKQALILFKTNPELQNLKYNQEVLKQNSDNKEIAIQKINEIPKEKMDIIYRFNAGEIDYNTAVSLMNQSENEQMNQEKQKVYQEQLQSLYQMANGELEAKPIPEEEKNNENVDVKKVNDWN